MRNITKTRLILFSVLTLLVLTVCNHNQQQISNNSVESDKKKIILDKSELKRSVDNSYTQVYNKSFLNMPGWALSVCTGDQDSDGNDEIIVGSNDYMYVFEYNSTQNNYTEVYKSPYIAGYLWTVSCGNDLDKDGKKEIFVCEYQGEMHVFEYNGTDNGYDDVFQEYYGSHPPGGSGNRNFIEEMWIGNDIDNDGEKEIIVGAGHRVNISEFNGVDDVYDEMWVSAELSGAAHISDVYSGYDLDGDGKEEIIVSSWDRIYVFENNGDNAYVGVWNRSNSIYCVSIGNDLDEDGAKEIIVGTGGPDNMVIIYEYNGTDNGYEQVWNSSLVTTIGNGVLSVITADDLDEDGNKEIIAGSYDDKMYIFEYNGTDNGYSKVWDSGSTFNWNIYSICIGDDIDNNGKEEIIIGSDEVFIFELETETPTPSTSSRPIIIIDEDDDDDCDEEDGIFISNQTLLIGGIISAVVLAGVVIILIKIKTGSGR